MSLDVQRFEPVYLELEPGRITDHGLRWCEQRYDENERFNATLTDIASVAYSEHLQWPAIQRILDEEGVPQNIANGISQYMMPKLMDHAVGKASFTIPATVAMTLCTANPSSTSTGASQAETVYTNYVRLAFSTATFSSATTATPSVSLNAGVLTFANCGVTGSTLLGWTMCDSSTTGAGNMLWFGGLTSTAISSTQTPPTIAAGALSCSLATSP